MIDIKFILFLSKITMEDIKAAKNFIYNLAEAKTVEGSVQRNFR